MCGRFSQAIPLEILLQLRAWHDLDPDLDQAMINLLAATYKPNYNTTPTQSALIAHPDTLPNHHHRLGFSSAHFGLIPSWAKDRSISAKMINARSETIADKPAFRVLIRSRRAVLPIDGFYEWQAIPGTKAKQPWYIHRADESPLLLACVWDTWLDHQHDATPVDSFAIITTAANTQIEPIHHRMPVVIEPESLKRWFDPEAHYRALEPIMQPAPEGVLAMHRVSTRVNSPANNDPALTAPDSTAPPNTLWG